MAIEFKLNGSSVALDVPADTPLLWAVRDEMNLKGTKFGCGIGMCGACTVHIDGVAQRSCITTVAAVAGKNITTIEGLSENGDHPLQRLGLLLRRSMWLLSVGSDYAGCQFVGDQCGTHRCGY